MAASHTASLVRTGASKVATVAPVSEFSTTRRNGLRVTMNNRWPGSSNAIAPFCSPSLMGQVASTARVCLSTTATSLLPATLMNRRLPRCSAAIASVKSVSKPTSPRRWPVSGSTSDTITLGILLLAFLPPVTIHTWPVDGSKRVESAPGVSASLPVTL